MNMIPHWYTYVLIEAYYLFILYMITDIIKTVKIKRQINNWITQTKLYNSLLIVKGIPPSRRSWDCVDTHKCYFNPFVFDIRHAVTDKPVFDKIMSMTREEIVNEILTIKPDIRFNKKYDMILPWEGDYDEYQD